MKVFFIGAGPGDPELLTIKGQKIIKRAEIVIYAGSLINKEILNFAKDRAKIYDSSKMSLNEITKIFNKAKEKDATIARIHSGDPSLYSAIQEQIDWCEKEKIPYEVIPGVSSFSAAAAKIKQELTLPGVSQSVILTRISGRTKVPPREDIALLARAKTTMVIFLSIQEIDKVVTKLLTEYSSETPVAIIYKVSWPEEKIIQGNLSNIAQKVKEAKVTHQAIILVGEVLKKKYQKSRLYNASFTHSFRKAKK
ncbi:precorrin-4 C(11)-methyltransferase [Candidatus Aerophobetes bacterium]|nr:precorrin-4 C(11)-methyltransferase [Candidatus Aerophobetes bacterium]